jgi:signal transduction histidine kinase
LFRYDGTLQHLAAHYGVEPETVAALQARYPRPPTRETVTGRALIESKVIHVADVAGDPSFPESQRITATAGYRSALAVPMMREGQPIGVIFVVRREAEAFSAKQVQLLETFASQAVIAVQNVRLFTELRESLEYQTAISDVLKVMSRSTFDLEPVLMTVIETATSLCRAQMGGVFQLEPDGAFRWKAGYSLDPSYEEHEKATPLYPGNDTLVGRVALRGAPVTELDALADPAYGPREIAEVGQVRSMLGVPMLRDGKLFGVMCMARNRVEAFTDKQVELVTVFADQAVIAIENVRLLNEIENRNKELAESLEIQTATSNVLGVISQSTFNLEPVLNTVATAAADLCHADEAAIFLLKDGAYRWAASRHINSAYIDAVRHEPFLPGNDSLIGRTALSGEVVQIEDAQSDPEYRRQDLARLGGVRTLLGIPLTRDGAMIGVMVLTRRHVERFTDKHVETLQVFADQAVIAIENVRLIKEIESRNSELAESLEYQTATSDVLKVMSRTTFELEPVLQTVIETAARLCHAHMGGVFQLQPDGAFHWKAGYGLNPQYEEHERSTPHYAGEDTLVGRVALRNAPVAVADAMNDPAYGPKDVAGIIKFHSMLGVPMMRDGKLSGVMCLARDRVEAFSPKQVELVTVFADQAVIAIENVRLITEIQEKSRQLEVASQHKSQFLANMSHELRTPLNAILGYTEMMVDGLYGDVPEKAQTVLERVQSNGKHLLGLINDVLDLSKIEAGQLTLAAEDYSVADMVSTVMSATESLARNKKLGLESAVPAGLPRGVADARRLAQVLLNLVGNAIKFTDEGKVVISAARVGENFEISVIDTGPGIAPADQAKIFEEFQQVDNTSTRKKGGTGLGLSISRKIVELHGGRISVESEVGKGSTFKVTIPINAALAKEAAQ